MPVFSPSEELIESQALSVNLREAGHGLSLWGRVDSGGTIEIAQRIAGHTSAATTRIYDRSGEQVTLEEIERVPCRYLPDLAQRKTRSLR